MKSIEVGIELKTTVIDLKITIHQNSGRLTLPIMPLKHDLHPVFHRG